MNDVFSPEEVRRMYRMAADKQQQFSILRDLCTASKEELCAILGISLEEAEPPPSKWARPIKPIPHKYNVGQVANILLFRAAGMSYKEIAHHCGKQANKVSELYRNVQQQLEKYKHGWAYTLKDDLLTYFILIGIPKSEIAKLLHTTYGAVKTRLNQRRKGDESS